VVVHPYRIRSRQGKVKFKSPDSSVMGKDMIVEYKVISKRVGHIGSMKVIGS
jgi:hypothetical protein